MKRRVSTTTGSTWRRGNESVIKAPCPGGKPRQWVKIVSTTRCRFGNRKHDLQFRNLGPLYCTVKVGLQRCGVLASQPPTFICSDSNPMAECNILSTLRMIYNKSNADLSVNQGKGLVLRYVRVVLGRILRYPISDRNCAAFWLIMAG